ncbi:MAG: GAF domain-containing sensor histidine kinase [Polyangiaceae bacterium]|nr:GAF domain-containing sensor histidine kinase [Polyangiaceae bacterium]
MLPEALLHLTSAVENSCMPAELMECVVRLVASVWNVAPHAVPFVRTPEILVSSDQTPQHPSVIPGVLVPGQGQILIPPVAQCTQEQQTWLRIAQSLVYTWHGQRRRDAYNKFAADVVEELRNSRTDEGIVPCLELIAQLANRVKGVNGAVTFAVDSGLRLAAHGFDPHSGWAQRNALVEQMGLWVNHQGGQLLQPKPLPFPEAHSKPGFQLRVYPLLLGEGKALALSGLLLVWVESSRVEKVDRLLLPFARVATWVVRDALRGEGMRRLRDLQELALEHQVVQPAHLVKRLAQVFGVAAASIFLDDYGVLRLAASTDAHLEKQGAEIDYQKGEGITGWVWQQGQPVRFSDLTDANQFRTSYCHLNAPKHPERALNGSPTARLLAVPVRRGTLTSGVIRMSRLADQAHFTQGEEDALSFFAGILGLLLVETWETTLVTHVQKMAADSVFLARAPETPDGISAPIVFAPNGAEVLYDLPSLVGVDASTLFPERAVRTAIKKALHSQEREIGPVEVSSLLPSGKRRHVEVHLKRLTQTLFNPPSHYWLVVARDVTTKKEREAEAKRTSEFLEAVNIAYFCSDSQGHTPRPTPMDCKLTGYSPTELQTNSRSILYYTPDDRDKLIQEVKKADGRLIKRIIKLKKKNGQPFFVEADLRLPNNSTGNGDLGLEGFYREVTGRIDLQRWSNTETDRVLTEQELFEKLKNSAVFQQDYLMSLGHQLLTPLVALIHTLRNIEQRVAAGDLAAQRFSYALGQTRTCIDMVEGLSFLGRIFKQEPLVKKEVSFARIAILVKLDVKHLLPAKNLTIVVDDASLDQLGPLSADPHVIRQVFVNLIDNAIKYSNPGSAVRIPGKVVSTGALIEVVNQGIVIPPDEAEKIFERGHRTPKAKALVPHGTGLGLWLVRHMLELHGARIDCRSEPLTQGGSRNRFRIFFPRQTHDAS